MSATHGTHWLDREDFGPVTVVRLKAHRLDGEATIRDVFDPIYQLAEIGRSRLVLNLAAVEYLPSMALAKLVMLNRKAESGEGRLALCGLSQTIHDVLHSTKLRDLFESYITEEEAIASFG